MLLPAIIIRIFASWRTCLGRYGQVSFLNKRPCDRILVGIRLLAGEVNTGREALKVALTSRLVELRRCFSINWFFFWNFYILSLDMYWWIWERLVRYFLWARVEIDKSLWKSRRVRQPYLPYGYCRNSFALGILGRAIKGFEGRWWADRIQSRPFSGWVLYFLRPSNRRKSHSH